MADNPWESEDFQAWRSDPEAFVGTPTGVQQAAPQVAAGQDAQAQLAPGQKLNPWETTDFTDAAKSWYGGRNVQGERNGWDSDFFREMNAQYEDAQRRAAEADDPNVFFSRFDPKVNKAATGIVTWDDQARGLRVGDVYEKGRKTGNLVDDFGWRDAATMMAPLLFDGVEQSRLFEAADKGDNTPLIEATQARTAEMTVQAEKAPSAKEFQDLLARKREEDGGTESVVGSTAAGAGATALAGAAIGSVVPGIGTAVGAIGGTLFGGLAGFLNRDQMTELVARTQAQTEIAGRSAGQWEAAMSQLSGWSQVAMTAASPLQNTLQGVLDWQTGELGDGVSEFYALDPVTKERKVNGWVEGANFVAAVGDAFSQFAAPASRALYMTSMGTTVAAGVGQTATGAVFDPTAGKYRDFQNVGEAAAAWGSVGIDALQMSVAGMLSKVTRNQRAILGVDGAATHTAAAAADPLVTGVVSRAAARARATLGSPSLNVDRAIDKVWASARGKELPANYTTQELNGMRYFFGDDLAHPVTSRMTAQLLVPSEFTKFIPTGFRARTRMAADKGMPTADDMYNTALEMFRGGNRFSNAFFNAQAEGWEEAAQAILDPKAYGESAAAGEVAKAAAMGFATGMGMSLGTAMGSPGPGMRSEALARRAYEIAEGRKVSTQEWRTIADTMGEDMVAVWGMMSKDQSKSLAGYAKMISDLASYESGPGNVLGPAAVDAAQKAAVLHQSMGALPNLGGSMVALPRTSRHLVVDGRLVASEFNANDAVMSLWRLWQLAEMKVDASKLHVQEAQSRIVELQSKLDAETDPLVQAALQAELDGINTDMADMGDAVALQEQFAAMVRENWDLYRTSSADVRAGIVDSLNRVIQNMAAGRMSNGAQAPAPEVAERNRRAVELFAARNPLMDNASFVRFVPHLSDAMSSNGQDAAVHLPQTSLKAMGADYDGDFLKMLNMAYIPPVKRLEYRLGGQYISTNEGWKDVLIDAPDADKFILAQFREYFLDPSGDLARLVTDELVVFEQWVRDRYSSVLGSGAVEAAITQWRDDVTNGVEKARINLVENLLNADTQKFYRMGDADAIPEANRLLEQVSLVWERATMATAKFSHTQLENDPNLTPAQILEQRRWIKEIPQLMAETYGTVLAFGLATPEGQRTSQQLNYLQIIKTAVDLVGKVDLDAVLSDQLLQAAFELNLMSSGRTQTAMAEQENSNVVLGRVKAWLLDAARQSSELIDPDGSMDLNEQELALLVGSLEVRAFRSVEVDGVLETQLEDGTISVIQMLLRTSIDLEKRRLTPPNGVAPTERPEWQVLEKLERLTSAGESRSYTASAALVEVFGGEYLSSMLGDSYALIGPDMPLAELVKSIYSKHEDYGRKDLLDKITRLSPARTPGVGDPPYSKERIKETGVTPYTIVVNAIKAVAQTHDDNLAKREVAAHENAQVAFNSIKRIIEKQTPLVLERIRKQPGMQNAQVQPADVLADLLSWNKELGELIVMLMPVDALRATFAVDKSTGQMVMAKWVNEALLAPTERGIFMFWAFSKLDHMTLLRQGKEDITDSDPVVAASTAAASSGIRMDKLRSRFERLVYATHLDSGRDGGLAMMELRKAIATSESIADFMTLVNGNPRLRGDQAPLLAWFDDVAEYETTTTDMHQRSLPSAALREQYSTAAQRLAQMAEDTATQVSLHLKDHQMKKNMYARVRDDLGGVYDDATNPETKGLDPATDLRDAWLKLLWDQVKRSKLFIDGVGPASRDNALASVQEGLFDQSDKGKADANLQPVGEILPLIAGPGLKLGVHQEIDNLTIVSYDDAMSNPSWLTEGPTRIRMPQDGVTVDLDLSTMMGVLEAWMDPQLEQLVNAAIFPILRDRTMSGTVQMYSAYDTSKGMEGLLEQSTNAQFVNTESGTPSTLDAHVLLSMAEAAAYKASEGYPIDTEAGRIARQEATLMVQNALNDFVVAYGVGPQRSKKNRKQVRDSLVRNYAQSLIEIAQLEGEARKLAHEMLQANLLKQVTGSRSMFDMLEMDDSTQELVDSALAPFVITSLGDKVREYQALEEAATTEAAKDYYRQRVERLTQKGVSPLESLMELDLALGIDLVRAKRAFEIDWDNTDAADATIQRIVEFLGSNNSVLHFRNGKQIDLVEKVPVLAGLLQETGAIDSRMLKPDQWELLAEWCVRVYVSNRSGATSGQFGMDATLTPQSVQYFDPSWAMLTNPLFDDRLLEAVRRITDPAGYDMSSDTSFNSFDVAGRVMQRLFSPDQIGPWTPVFPSWAMKARQALLVTPVKSAIPMSGTSPIDMFEVIGAGQVSLQLPNEAEHESDFGFDWTVGADLWKLLDLQDKRMTLKLEHHFVRSIVVEDPSGQIPADQLDLTNSVGRLGLTREAQPDSPYSVLELDRLQAQLEKLAEQHQVSGLKVNVRYVDIDKKPYAREWANNMFFEGVGREYETNFANSLASSMIFASDAVNKQGQQVPLEYSKRPGSGFISYIMQRRQRVTQIETSFKTVTETLERKARDILSRPYETGALQKGDMPSVLKMMRNRHLVRRVDAEGNERLMWAEEAIALEMAELRAQLDSGVLPADLVYTEYQLIPLDEVESRILLGGEGSTAGYGLLRGQPVMNPEDIDPFPQITQELLTRVGLSRLGEKDPAANSAFARVRVLPRARMLEAEPGPQAQQTETFTTVRHSSTEAMIARAQMRGFNIGEINASHQDQLLRMFRRDRSLTSLLADVVPEARSQKIADAMGVIQTLQLDSVLETPSNVIWVYRRGTISEMLNGGITKHDVDNDFGWGSPTNPLKMVQGDVFLLDLGVLLAENGESQQQAYEAAQRMIRGLARRRVRVVLQSSTGPQNQLRSDLAYWIEQGELNYQAMRQSNHFFEPITQQNYVSLTERARERSLSATTVFTAMGAEFAIVMDDEPALHDGGGYADFDRMYEFARDVTVQLPSHLTVMGPGRARESTFGIVRNTTSDVNVTARFVETMLPILKEPGAAAALGLRNPTGVPLREVTETPDGTVITQPGILSADDAVAELVELLETGADLYVGRTLRPGALIPYMDRRGEIIIHQYGFELPTEQMLNDTRAAGLQSYPGSVKPLLVTVSNPELARKQTIPPDFVIKEIAFTDKGLRARGDARLDKNAKSIWQLQGVKAGLTELPDHFRLATHKLGLVDGNDLSVTQFMGSSSVAGKGGVKYRTDNFSDAFAVLGFNGWPYLEEFFGKYSDGAGMPKDTIKKLLQEWSNIPLDLSETDVLNLLQSGGLASKYRNEMHGVFGAVMGDSFDTLFDDLTVQTDEPSQRIAQVILACLLLPGVRLEHVIGTVGLINMPDPRHSTDQIVRVNEIMASAFDDRFNYPETFSELFHHMNSHLARGPLGEQLFNLREDWKFEFTVTGPDGAPMVRVGTLQYILPVPAEQNQATYLQRFIMNRWDNISPHTGAMVSAALGGRVPDRAQGPAKGTRDFPQGKAREKGLLADWADGSLQESIAQTEDRLGWFGNTAAWSTLSDPSYSSWGTLNYAERQALEEGRAAARLYSIPIKRGHEFWDETSPEHTAYLTVLDDILRELNMDVNESGRRWVEIMVRQMRGIPGPAAGQDENVGNISLATALQAATDIYKNVVDFYIPTMGGEVPLLHADMLRTIFEAQQKPGIRKWAPRAKEGVRGQKIPTPTTFDEWVSVSVGQVLSHTEPYEAMFGPALNGMWQSYNGATMLSENLTVSFETAAAIGLRSERLDSSIRDVVAFSEIVDAAMQTPLITDVQTGDLINLSGLAQTYQTRDVGAVGASTVTLHNRRRSSWRAQKKMVKQEEQTVQDYRKSGARYMENNNRLNVWARNLSTWSLINRMANPGIWVSALIEVPFRRSTEFATHLVTGDLLGKTGETMADHPTSRYTKDEVQLLEGLIKYLGDSKLFMKDVQNQISYAIVGDNEVGNGRFTRGLENVAGGMVRWVSDPWHGMRGDTLAREYVYGVLEYLNMTNNALTVEQLVDEVVGHNQPLWIKTHFVQDGLSPHKQGMNRVAQTRAMKATMLSLPISRGLNGLTSRPGAGLNIAGHLLRIPLMFQLFTFNALTTMTGMSGWDQAAAMFLSGREKPKFLRSAANRALGEDAPSERWDFSDVIETLDLQRTFIRSNITVSMLATLGLMAGNLGLDGEDEEAKRRARLAKYLNVPLLNDPYEPQNSFKYADAIFLDSIPFLSTVFKDSRGEAAIVPHWILRQFTSPILGLQRFFDTGDLREIGYGFADAFSVIPNSVLRLWNQADLLGGQLADQAKVTSEYDSTEMQGATNSLIMNIVTTYEKMIAENSFINTIYTASDDFDRNPYAIPKTTETGDIVRQDGTGLPLSTTTTTTEIGPDGKPVESYVKRSPDEARLYAYTENNATAAVIASLFTGRGESEFLRQNMVVKQETVTLPQLNADQAKAMILSAYIGGGGEFRMSKLDLVNLIKQQIKSAGGRWDQEAVEAQADEILAAHDERTALSVGTEKGEVLTQYGAERIYHSLMKGTIKLGDPTLAGMSIPFEMRKEVAASLIKEIMQDAIDKGLSYESATYVANRYWYGDKENPEIPGLRTYLESKEIPYDNRVQYNQLNVMYAIGPDGRPWATPFERNRVVQAFGIPVPNMIKQTGPGTHLDNLGNVVDEVLGINVGLSALEREPTEPLKIPNPVKSIKKGDLTPGGGSSYGRRYSSGGGGGGGSSYGPPFQRMYELPGGTSPRFGGIPMINTSNPYIRRAQVNRERVFSERGRLKQWQ